MISKIQQTHRMVFLIFAAAAASLVLSGNLLAKPEQILLKNPQAKANEMAALQKIKAIDAGRIEDPEARKAIQAIVSYLTPHKASKL